LIHSGNLLWCGVEMIPTAVRCILFDAVGTLIYPYPPVHVAYALAGRDFGLSLDEAIVERRFARAFGERHGLVTGKANLITNEEIERRRWRAIVGDVFAKIAQCETLFERLWNHFARPSSWRLFDDVADCWRRLTERGLSLGIASNFDQRLLDIRRGLPPLNQCEHCFVSSQIGFRKPARQFFRAIERAIGLDRQQFMLVGDDWDTDYRAAGAVGWHALHLNRVPGVSSTTSIRSLAELASDARLV
jgi:putative hydrolase of the HAD superfamily